MSRANPFNKDTKALEDNLHWRKADVDQAYEAGYYLRWAITKLHYVSLETLPWMFYNYQNRKVRVQQLSNFCRYLGIHLDPKLSFEVHLNVVLRKMAAAIRS